ncbi:MAG: hypothetical protein GY797_41220 [Deltaproteobacteria bacterium]|nr:hypothetical protein [Deltaproteobacteria bacterium]
MTRPLAIDLTVHRAKGLSHEFADPDVFLNYLSAASELFAAANINLTPINGSNLSNDPWRKKSWLKKQLKLTHPNLEEEKRRVVLLLSKRHIDSPSINGMLADTNSRSIAVLFTNSNGFSGVIPDRHFQILVHELGHVFNLIHSDAFGGTHASVMNQDDGRPNSRKDMITSWTATLDQLDPRDKTDMKSFFMKGERDLIGLPFSPNSLSFLKRADTNSVLPWEDPFRSTGDIDHFDRTNLELICELLPEREGYSVGEPFDFQIRILNTSKNSDYNIPLHLGMKFGNTNLRIRQPDNTVYDHQSRTVVSAEGLRALKPGETVLRSFSILHSLNGVVFPVAGKYVFSLLLPSLGMRADPIEIDVAGPRLAILGNRNFQTFLGHGLPTSSRQGWKIMNKILDTPNALSPSVISHLDYLYASCKPTTSRGRASFSRCLKAEYGNRIREKILLQALQPETRKSSLWDYDSNQILKKTQELFSIQDLQHPSLTQLNSIFETEELQ